MTRDMVKTLRTQAQLFRQMKNPAQGDMLDRAADEVHGLRAELAALRNAARWEREAGSQEAWEAMANGLPRLYLSHGEEYTDEVQDELGHILECAVEAVDALVGEG